MLILYSLVFVSLMMVLYESKHVGNNVMSNNRVYVTQLSVFSWSLINSDKIHGQCKILKKVDISWSKLGACRRF